MTLGEFRQRLEAGKVTHQALLTDQMVKLIDGAIEAAELAAYDLARRRLILAMALMREAYASALEVPYACAEVLPACACA